MSTSVEKDVLQYGLIIGIIYQFYQSILSLFPLLFPTAALINILITVFLIFLYVIIQKKNQVQVVAFLLHLLALAAFSYFWIMNGGLAGTVPNFLCLYISFIVITSREYYRLAAITLLIALVTIYFLFPESLGMTSFYEPANIAELQKTIDYLVIAGIIVAFTLYIKKKLIYYRGQSALRHQQLKKIALTLADQNHELATREEETRAINDNLESLVEERILEIENKNKALSEFAFINAHMLRGPLCRIIGLIQLMERNPNHYDQKRLNDLKRVANEIDKHIKTINAAVS